MSSGNCYRKTIHPFVEPLHGLFSKIDEFYRDAVFAHGNGKDIVARDLVIILLAVIQVLTEHGIKRHAWISFKNVERITLPMPYLVAESISEISMKSQVF